MKRNYSLEIKNLDTFEEISVNDLDKVGGGMCPLPSVEAESESFLDTDTVEVIGVEGNGDSGTADFVLPDDFPPIGG